MLFACAVPMHTVSLIPTAMLFLPVDMLPELRVTRELAWMARAKRCMPCARLLEGGVEGQHGPVLLLQVGLQRLARLPLRLVTLHLKARAPALRAAGRGRLRAAFTKTPEGLPTRFGAPQWGHA